MADGEVVIVDAEGTEHVFPAGFDPKRAAAIVKGQTTIPTTTPTAAATSTAPAAPGSGLGTMASAFKTALSDELTRGKDVGLGIAKGAAHTVLDVAQLGSTLGLSGPQGQQADRATIQRLRDATAYSNPTQQVGGAAESLAELALPITKVAEAVPTTAKAGKLFQEVMGAARSVPVDMSEPGTVALRIADLAQHGGGTNWGPGPVRQFIQYVTDPKKPAMTYEVGRDFASNISKLSFDELRKLPPVMGREVTKLSVTLNKAVGQAAAKVGKGAEYAQAMKQYARAKRMLDVYDAAIEGAKRHAPWITATGAAGAAGAWLYKTLANVMGE